MTLSLFGRLGDFQLPPQIEQNTVHTHNRHVSRTDKQHMSRSQTITSTRSGYTTDEYNQQCEVFQDTVTGPVSHPAVATVPRIKHLITKLNNTEHIIGR